MPKAYWIVRVSVRDEERYPEYLAAARPAFEKYGANFIVRGWRVRRDGGQCARPPRGGRVPRSRHRQGLL